MTPEHEIFATTFKLWLDMRDINYGYFSKYVPIKSVCGQNVCLPSCHKVS